MKRVVTVLALFSLGFVFAALLCNTVCFAECYARYPKQVYCVITEYTTPGHTYCTTTINNREYKYLHHACDSTSILEWNPGTNLYGKSNVTQGTGARLTVDRVTVTRLGVCQIYQNLTYSILPQKEPTDLCFSCNTNYFAFLYRILVL